MQLHLNFKCNSYLYANMLYVEYFPARKRIMTMQILMRLDIISDLSVIIIHPLNVTKDIESLCKEINNQYGQKDHIMGYFKLFYDDLSI